MRFCNYVGPREFAQRCGRIRRHYSGAAKSRWQSSRSPTQFFRMAARVQLRRTFWNASKKRTARSGTRNARAAAGKTLSSPRQPTRCIHAWRMRSRPERERRRAHNLASKNSRLREKPARPTILLMRSLPATTAISPARPGLGSISRKRSIAARLAGNWHCRCGSMS